MVTSARGTLWFDDITLKETGMVVEAEYTANGNYLAAIKDASGETIIQYSYDTVDGRNNYLIGTYSSVTDARGNRQHYTYDVMDRVTGVEEEASQVSQSYTYNTFDHLATITREDFTYTFVYDNFGRLESVQTPAHTLVTNSYCNIGTLTSTTYGNGQTISFGYDDLYRLTDVEFMGQVRFSYHYDARGNITRVTDNVNHVTTYYTYDPADRLTNFREIPDQDSPFPHRYVTFGYDKNNNATELREVIDGEECTTSFTYNLDNTLATLTTPGGQQWSYYYDEQGRPHRVVTELEPNVTLYSYYRYNQKGMLELLEQTHARYQYSYDANGNITEITRDNGTGAQYQYDSLNQLTEETIVYSGGTRVISYTYDKLGNMEARVEGDTRTEYSYSYDRLTAIERYENDILTETITLTYDEAGNIINDGEYSYSWEMGRQLAGITGTELDISFSYNQNGLRTSKAVTTATGTTSHYYTYLGSSVTRERIVNEDQQVITIHYSYAGGHSPVSMSVDGTEYHYLKNAQGDITHIVDSSGNIVVEYEYNAWGNILSITGDQELGRLNPYRYRGYRYDEETGLYYLQSRYYNPEWGRFINADVLIGIGTRSIHNQYTYCRYNPVNLLDTDGYIPQWLRDVGRLIWKGWNFVTNPWVRLTSATVDSGRVMNDGIEEIASNLETHARNVTVIGSRREDIQLAPIRGIDVSSPSYQSTARDEYDAMVYFFGVSPGKVWDELTPTTKVHLLEEPSWVRNNEVRIEPVRKNVGRFRKTISWLGTQINRLLGAVFSKD